MLMIINLIEPQWHIIVLPDEEVVFIKGHSISHHLPSQDMTNLVTYGIWQL